MKAYVSAPVEMPEIFHEGTSVPGSVSEEFLPWGRCWETKALRAPTTIRNVVGGKTNTHVFDADPIGYWTKILTWRSCVCICPPK